MSKPKYFRYKHFLNINNYPKYFVFNDEININEIENEEEKFDELNFEYEKNIDFLNENFFNKYLSEKEKEMIAEKSYSDKIDFFKAKLQKDPILMNKIKNEDLFEIFKNVTNDFKKMEIILSGVQIVEEKAIDKTIEEFKKNFPNEKYKIFSKKNSTENLIRETKEAILSKKYGLLINPVFEYRNIIASPLYFNLITKTISSLNYSFKSSLKNIMRAYFDTNIIEKSGHLINDYVLTLPSYNKNKDIKKHVIDFYFSRYSNIVKDIEIDYDKFTTNEIQLIATGQREKIKKHKFIPIIEHIRNNLTTIEKKYLRYTIGSFINIINDCENDIDFQKLTEITLKDFENGYVLNKNVKNITKRIFPDWENAAKKLIVARFDANSKKSSENNKALNFYYKDLIYINKAKWNNDIEVFLENKRQHFVWFDFEGFTLPIPPLDYTRSWTQLVSQLSIIKTKNNKEYESNDFVYDPLYYSYKDLIKIINDIYTENVDAYIVFNKAYEETRIKEIVEKLWLFHEDGVISEEEVKICEEKANEIISKILDLANFFVNRKPLDFTNAFLNISNLLGKYSIKIIEKYATKNYPNLEHMIIPYQDLEVKNGSMALEIATTRALGIIKDEEWNQKTEELKKYCHNDVMAMIMAGDLIKVLYNNIEKFNKECEEVEIF
ncbi:UU173 family protein [Metamycoplasma buccale]|uniref:UU173 family protein n=1 Tax=Metamycoplasma buccale TaxID=55602 RepID=UPI00398F3177